VLAAPSIPLALSALVFLALAVMDWRRLPVWSRVHLGVATAFAVAAFAHPGMTIKDVVDQGHDGVAYLAAVARVAGMVAALVTVTTRVREHALGR
jgi:hypothetical protein